MNKPHSSTNKGFTLVEIAVGIAILGIMIISIANLFIAIEAIQRQSLHLALAHRAAEQEIESLRNSHYNTLALSPPNVDFTDELPPELASPRSGEVVISEPQPGIKRLDLTITYRNGRRTKTVKMSALLGNIGISQ